VIEVEADGFLYNMVRNIAGTLVEVGRGRRPESWPAEVLAARDRRETMIESSSGYASAISIPSPFQYPSGKLRRLLITGRIVDGSTPKLLGKNRLTRATKPIAEMARATPPTIAEAGTSRARTIASASTAT